MANADDFYVPPPASSATTASPQAAEGPHIASGSQPVLSPTTNETFAQSMTYGLPLLGVGLIDTLGQSLHLLHSDTIPKVMNQYVGGEAADFYTRHREGLRAGAEVATMPLPGLAMYKVLKTIKGAREAGTLGTAMKNSVALDVLLGNSADMAASEKAVRAAASAAVQDWGITAGRTVATPAVVAAKRGYYAKRAVDAARTAAAFEVGNAVAFNSSDTFYP